MLAQFIDRPVGFVGRLEKTHPGGKMFILSDGEGKKMELLSDRPSHLGLYNEAVKITRKFPQFCPLWVVQ
ncbi:unnamed protein product [Nyctereutes procyonoides]|uniref:(raccoon dog) hypothetical protein n=1 Tax=Nyctereutes procyonoides TaxID=34880 RepID=A0A811YYW4_NYCPR|nr:unnamed protein product [Nyctereutes procyonoides]